MTDPGLTNRLRQHSRRAGIMVGLSMALTIAICVGGFTTIYARLAPFTSDFVAANTPVPTERPRSTQIPATSGDSGGDAPAPTPTAPPPPPTPTPTVAPTPTPAFEPDLQSNSQLAVNLRQEPGTQANIVTVLTAQTPLQSLGEEQTGPDGETWIRVRTEEGEEGWIWRNSADPYQPET